MLSQGQELSALDFGNIIGGPLIAVINAQAAAAITTTNFIQKFAFVPNRNPPQLAAVTFDFSQVIGPGLKSAGLTSDVTSISVPLLTIIPIPFIRIEDMSINFNVSLHSVSTTSFSNDFAFSLGASGSYFGCGMAVSVTDKNTYQNSSVVDDTYSLEVTVHAVQDQMPGGMANVLGIFSNIIQSQASLIQAIVTAEVQQITNKAQTQIKKGTTPAVAPPVPVPGAQQVKPAPAPPMPPAAPNP